MEITVTVKGDTLRDIYIELMSLAKAFAPVEPLTKEAEAANKPAAKGKAKPKPIEELVPDEEFDLGEETEELSDDEDLEAPADEDDELDVAQADDVPALTLKDDVIPAFNKYIQKQKKKYKGDSKKAFNDAKKILTKFKVSRVNDLKPQHFEAAMEAVA